MVIIDALRKLSHIRRTHPSSQHHGSNRMESYSLPILPFLHVWLEYPANMPTDILSAAEMVVILLASAFAQLDVRVDKAVIEVAETEVKVSLIKDDGSLLKAYTFTLDILTDAVRQAQLLVGNNEDLDFKHWFLQELDNAYHEYKLW